MTTSQTGLDCAQEHAELEYPEFKGLDARTRQELITKMRQDRDQGILYQELAKHRSWAGFNLTLRMVHDHLIIALYHGVKHFDTVVRDLFAVSLMNAISLRSGEIAVGHGWVDDICLKWGDLQLGLNGDNSFEHLDGLVNAISWVFAQTSRTVRSVSRVVFCP